MADFTKLLLLKNFKKPCDDFFIKIEWNWRIFFFLKIQNYSRLIILSKKSLHLNPSLNHIRRQIIVCCAEGDAWQKTKVPDHVGFVPQRSTDKIGDLSIDNCEILSTSEHVRGVMDIKAWLAIREVPLRYERLWGNRSFHLGEIVFPYKWKQTHPVLTPQLASFF